ncbi:hypothetical protein OAC51_01225 [Flavobacteriaceae bacterium]|nr:hypothetical protein [Flavobacteriaceae bacterium]
MCNETKFTKIGIDKTGKAYRRIKKVYTHEGVTIIDPNNHTVKRPDGSIEQLDLKATSVAKKEA